VKRHRSRFFALVPVVVAAVLAVSTSAASAAESCPNEALRQESNLNPFTLLPFSTQLPECRAYELASPPFAAGAHLRVEASDPNADSMIAVGEGRFAGAESSRLGPFVKIGRIGPAGPWQVSSLNPSAEIFPANSLQIASRDLEKTLWETRGPAQSLGAKDIYLREPNGNFVAVGPMAPPERVTGPPAGNSPSSTGRYQIVGANDDLSTVLFQTLNVEGAEPGLVWPGDTTAFRAFSLYEYKGTNNVSPRLVGVSDGSIVVNGTIVPNGALISDCSTSLGAVEGADVYNAISANGATIYFTAEGHSSGECTAPAAPEVTEIFARVDAHETVPISEPTAAQCAACGVSPQKPATFQGASSDGTKAFFLTEQSLLEASEGVNLYEYDSAGAAGSQISRVSFGATNPEVLGVSRVSADGTHVYFVAHHALPAALNSLGQSPIEGGFNLYCYQRTTTSGPGTLSFVASLSEEDTADWRRRDNRPVDADASGNRLVFGTRADVEPGETSQVRRIFLYDSATGELRRVSRAQPGYVDGQLSADANEATLPTPGYTEQWRPTETARANAISSDGSLVTFISRAGLTESSAASAAAGALSVYAYRTGTTSLQGSVSLISSGANVDPSAETQVAVGGSGTNILFLAPDELVTQDRNSQTDLYDARVGGGSVGLTETLPCAPESCQGPLQAPPRSGDPVTGQSLAERNSQPRRPKKGHRKKHKRKHRRTAKPQHQNQRNQREHSPGDDGRSK
jgi:hypothetical protein